MGWVEPIARIIPQGTPQELSTGIQVKAMLSNALGFIYHSIWHWVVQFFAV
ncbi:hypothetical protein JJD41_17575 [Oxynema sp. CENA135]|uniref:hypothetical protein n=1 Tax=Oxynema sp. CENA135 TaxID=984206 RepID=UPI00190CFE4D|nr:hypothetical protein [Oxynema sp. CENA135]